MRISILVSVLILLGVSVAKAQPSAATNGHEVVLNGVRLWYKVSGRAHAGVAPLIYLAGGPGYNSYSFERTIGSQLERHLQVIYFDERGTGRSERPKSVDYTMSTLAADVEALREALHFPQLSVMGQSFGGTIAMEYAARYPEHVQRLIILDGAVDYPEAYRLWETELQSRVPDRWAQAMATPAGKALADAEAHPEDACALAKARFAVVLQIYATPGMASFHHWQQFHDQRFQKQQEAWDARSGLNNTGELSNAYFSIGNPALCYQFRAYNRLTMPMLVIAGKYDGAAGPQQAQIILMHLPHARYDEFQESAHFPYAEEPAKFVKEVSGFLVGGKNN